MLNCMTFSQMLNWVWLYIYIHYRIPTTNNIKQLTPLLPHFHPFHFSAHLANHKNSWIPPFGQPHVWPDICSIPDWSLVDPSSELQLLLPPSARGSRWQDLATPSSTWAARSRHATKTKRDVGSPNQWQNADALSPWRGFMVLGERRVWQGTWGPLKGIDISKISKKQMASVYCITRYESLPWWMRACMPAYLYFSNLQKISKNIMSQIALGFRWRYNAVMMRVLPSSQKDPKIWFLLTHFRTHHVKVPSSLISM